jgi:hypothetical protein
MKSPTAVVFQRQSMVPIKLKLNCWSVHNSRILPWFQLHGIKREACYATNEIRMFKITLFPGTINSEKYKPHIAQEFSENLSEVKRGYGCFQDDCATVRTYSKSIATLSNISGGRCLILLSRLLVHPFWRHVIIICCEVLQLTFVETKTHTQESTFKAIVRCAVSAASKRYLKQFCNNMFNSCQTCLNVEGCPFWHSLICNKLYHVT